MSDCVYFGVRTSEREGTVRCRRCKADDPNSFKDCTVETNTLMGTSVTVDEAGNTVHVPPAMKVSSHVLASDEDISPVVKVRRVRGIWKLAQSLVSQGKSDAEIKEKLIRKYMDEGNRSESEAIRLAKDNIYYLKLEREKGEV